MTTDYGVVLQGFKRKKPVAILADINVRTRAVYGQAVNLKPESLVAQYNSIFAYEMGFAWETMEKLYHSTDPTQAEGVHLVNLLNLMGLEGKAPATSSEVVITVNGVSGVEIPQGSELEDVLFGEKFTNRHSAIIGADGTVTMKFYALNKGRLDILENTVTQINTAVSGWQSANNPEEGISGKDIESDSDARSRASNVRPPENTIDKLYTDLVHSAGVKYLRVYYNINGDASSPVEPSHFAVVADGDFSTKDIAEKLWTRYPLGLVSDGDITEDITDRQGFCRQMKFFRAERLYSYIKAEVEYCPAQDCGCSTAGGGDFSDIEDSLWAWILDNNKKCGWGIGMNLSASSFYGAITKNHQEFSVSCLKLSKDGSVWDDVITTEWNQVAYFSRERIDS